VGEQAQRRIARLAEAAFDVFLTVDRNLSFQQDVGRFNWQWLCLLRKAIATRIFNRSWPTS
jgi:hypothetical protein